MNKNAKCPPAGEASKYANKFYTNLRMNANLQICEYIEGMQNDNIKCKIVKFKNNSVKIASTSIIVAASFLLLANFANAGVISSAPTFAQIGLKILNFLLSVFAMVAIIGMLISGMLYFFARGDERAMQKAKRSFSYGVIGIGVALSGLIILKFISGILS